MVLLKLEVLQDIIYAVLNGMASNMCVYIL